MVAIIPARYHATRLPGKPLALIAGKPMVAHVCARAAKAASVDHVLVATDDTRIAEAVDAAGGTAVMTRTDHPSGTDRLAEVAAHLTCDIVVNLQGDEPLLDPRAVDAAVAPLLADEAVTLSTLRTPLTAADADNPNVVKVVINLAGDALYFSRAAVPYLRPGHAPAQRWRHLGLYVYRRTALLRLAGLPSTPMEQAEGLEQLRALEHGLTMRTVAVNDAPPSVDTPEDLARVRALVESNVESSATSNTESATVSPHA